VQINVNRCLKITGKWNCAFSLDYLIPTYQLKLGEEDISELSPGERGALLLIFYRILFKSNGKPCINKKL
jgi:hypothetical protein